MLFLNLALKALAGAAEETVLTGRRIVSHGHMLSVPDGRCQTMALSTLVFWLLEDTTNI